MLPLCVINLLALPASCQTHFGLKFLFKQGIKIPCLNIFRNKACCASKAQHAHLKQCMLCL
jgi:hypothetical protein